MYGCPQKQSKMVHYPKVVFSIEELMTIRAEKLSIMLYESKDSFSQGVALRSRRNVCFALWILRICEMILSGKRMVTDSLLHSASMKIHRVPHSISISALFESLASYTFVRSQNGIIRNGFQTWLRLRNVD